ncbi:MAG: zinc ribbon domain-containing protein [Firmicutes bacterium]|nr:zinc ribbon domain-containing protein [Bacillota bacterium]
MYCKHCGFKVPEGAEFCDNCGHRMNASNWIDKLESLREDELTHAGEQPRKTDLFPDRPSKKSSGKRVDLKKSIGRANVKPLGGASRKKADQSETAKVVGSILTALLGLVVSILMMMLD